MRKDTRFKFTLGVFTLALATLLAAQPPAWWSSSSTPVVDPNATTTGVEQNYAPANLGQLKFIAKQAKLHLDANLNGGSGIVITSLVSGFTPLQGVSYTQAELDALRAANYAPINLGQLKAVAKPFYDRLLQSGYDTKANLIDRGYPSTWPYDYPWNPSTPVADNYAPANIGQLKLVFSFDLTGFEIDPSLPVSRLTTGVLEVQVGDTVNFPLTFSNPADSITVSGLPSGLTWNPTLQLIQGSPTQPGITSVSVQATNSYGTASGVLALIVWPNTSVAPVINSLLADVAVAGSTFAYRITAENRPTSYEALGLPAGLQVDGATGFISGVTSQTGSYNVTIKASNAGGTDTKTLALTVVSPNGSVPTITSPLTATGSVGSSFSYSIVATGSPSSYSVEGLPAGLSLNAGSGIISGSPEAGGVTTPVVIRAANSYGSASQILNITVAGEGSTITSPLHVYAVVEEMFSYQLAASNHPTSFSVSGLPAWLSFDASTGILIGTPPAPVSPVTVPYDVTVSLAAANEVQPSPAPVQLMITVGASRPDVTSSLVESTLIASPYSYQITATSNPTSYGAEGLPAGLGLNAGTGVISGTPSEVGDFSVRIWAANSSGGGEPSYLRLRVSNPDLPQITSASKVYVVQNQPFSYEIAATGSPTSYQATNLPSGLTFNPATHVISGTLATVGTPRISISASNPAGTTSETLKVIVLSASTTVSAFMQFQAGTSPRADYQAPIASIVNDPDDTSAVSRPDESGVVGAYVVGSAYRTLLKFDLQDFPADAEISSGELRVTAFATKPMAVELRESQAFVPESTTWNTNSAYSQNVLASNSITALAQEEKIFPTSTNFVDALTSAFTPAGGYAVYLELTSLGAEAESDPANLPQWMIVSTDRASSFAQRPLLKIGYTTGAPPEINEIAGVTGVKGAAFNYHVVAQNAPASYAASGLPSGLAINPTTGVVSGVPAQYGQFPVLLSATNVNGTGTSTWQLTIHPAAPTITSSPTATVSYQGNFSYAIQAPGATSYDATGLPYGLSIDKTTGVISGTPTSWGTYIITIRATNAGGTTNSTLALTVQQTAPVITSALTAQGNIGANFTYYISAKNGVTSYAATGLPPGLSLGSYGSISGTPAQEGSFQVQISATNPAGVDTKTLELTVGPSPVPIIQAENLRCEVGFEFSYDIQVTNDADSYQITGLPPGLYFSDGWIFGTPTESGTFTVSVGATNQYGTGTGTFTLDVSAGPIIVSDAAVSGVEGNSFWYSLQTFYYESVTVTATGLPPGLNLDGVSISGVPTQSGVYPVGLTVANEFGSTTFLLTITIQPLPALTSGGTVSCQVGVPLNYQLTADNSPTGWTASGLPIGLQVDGATGAISGTPTAAGQVVSLITVTNAAGMQQSPLVFNVAATSTDKRMDFQEGVTPSVSYKTFTASIAKDTGNPAVEQNGAANAAKSLIGRSSVSASGRMLLAFDLSALPENAAVTAGSLSIFVGPNDFHAQSLDVRLFEAAFPFDPANPNWVDNSAAKGAELGRATLTANGSLVVPGSAALAQAIQTARSTDAPTVFLVLEAPVAESGNVESAMITAHDANAVLNPKLTVNYTAGAPTEPPQITSPLEVTVFSGDLLEYGITATNGPTSFGATGLPAGFVADAQTGGITGASANISETEVTLSATNEVGTGNATLYLKVDSLMRADELAIVSGNNQSASLGEFLALPFVVRAERQGSPVPGTLVTFKVPTGDGLLAVNTSTAPQRSRLSAITDANGVATVFFKVPTVVKTVEITAESGNADPVKFVASSQLSPDTDQVFVRVVSGNAQVAPAGAQLPNPVQVEVVDKNGLPVSGAALSYTVLQGSATVTGGPVTGSDGHALMSMTLAGAPGTVHRVQVASGGAVALVIATTASSANNGSLPGGNAGGNPTGGDSIGESPSPGGDGTKQIDGAAKLAVSGLKVDAQYVDGEYDPTTVKLTWNDDSEGEQGFRLERKISDSEWSTVAALGADVKEYTDSGLKANRRYFYRVTAFRDQEISAPAQTVYRVPLVKGADWRRSDPYAFKTGWEEFTSSGNKPKYYTVCTESFSGNDSSSGDHWSSSWNGSRNITIKVTTYPDTENGDVGSEISYNGSSSYNSSDSNSDSGHWSTTTRSSAMNSNGGWTGSGRTRDSYGGNYPYPLYSVAWDGYGAWLSETPTQANFVYGSITLSDEYTTERLVSDVDSAMPNWGEWFDYHLDYAFYYWEGSGGWNGYYGDYDDLDYYGGTGISYRHRSQDETSYGVNRSQYRFNFYPAFPERISWYEIFAPEDDPETAENESLNFSIYKSRSVSTSSPRSGEYTVDARVRGEDGSYLIFPAGFLAVSDGNTVGVDEKEKANGVQTTQDKSTASSFSFSPTRLPSSTYTVSWTNSGKFKVYAYNFRTSAWDEIQSGQQWTGGQLTDLGYSEFKVVALNSLDAGATTTITVQTTANGQQLDSLTTKFVYEPPTGSLSIPVDEASGARYRKISLSGTPLPDGKPQQTEESGQEPEESFIDALTLGVRHSTTDAYQAVPGSDLSLSARRDYQSEVWNLRSGLRPQEDPAKPFGVCWSSNLVPHIKMVTVPDEPTKAYVTDESGATHTFVVWYEAVKRGDQTVNIPKFFPMPTAKNQQTPNLSSLEVSQSGGNSTYVFKRKYGTTLSFETALTKTFSSNRFNTAQSTGTKYTYARLKTAVDRLGYTVNYSYENASNLIPKTISVKDHPDLKLSIRQDGGLITKIWDAKGYVTTFEYEDVDYTNLLNVGSVKKLARVIHPDGSVTKYDYTFAEEVSEEPLPPEAARTKYWHCDIASITDPLNHTYLFDYNGGASSPVFDHSKRDYKSDDFYTGYFPQSGLPRNIRKITLPSGANSEFSNDSNVWIKHSSSGEYLAQGLRRNRVTDVEGLTRTYDFGSPLVIPMPEVAKVNYTVTKNFREPKIIVYQDMTVTHGSYGAEKFEFDIDAAMALKRSTDLSGNTTTFEYGDTWGAPSDFRKILPGSAYGHHSDPTRQTNAMGGVKSFTYTAESRLMTSVTDEEGRTTSYEMDSKGRRTKETISGDGATQVTKFVYGNSKFPGFVTRKTMEKQGGDASPTSSLVTEYTPDANGRVAKETVAPGSLNLTTSYTYDANGNKKSMTDPRGNTTWFGYDKCNRLVAVSYPDGGAKYLIYDARGNKTKEIDENGHATLFSYDNLNRVVTQVRDMNGNGANDGRGTDLVTSFTYSPAGAKLTEMDPRGHTTTHEYDALLRLKLTRDAANNVTTFDYGANSGGSAFESSGFKPTRTVSPRGVTTSVTYDKLYRPTVTKVSATGTPTLTTAIQYDRVGNAILTTDGLNRQTKTQYDGLNRPVKITYPDGTFISNAYSSTGLKWKVTDELGRETVTEYDAAGRATLVRAPQVDRGDGTLASPETRTIYDAAGNALATINPLGRQWDYTYDVRNRKVRELQPAVVDALTGQSKRPAITTRYDAMGHVISVTDALGNTTDTEYDAASRVTDVYSPMVPLLGGASARPHVHTTYDANGNALTVTDPNGHTTTNTYDNLNRLLTTTDAAGIVVSNQYDEAGNRTMVTDGLGQQTRFEYDGLNRNTRVTDATGRSTSFQYDAINKIQRTDALGQVTSYTYDPRNRLKLVIYANGGDQNPTQTRAYDAVGNLLSVTEAGKGGKADVAYSYDNLNRTISETSGGDTHQYKYDLAGNRVRCQYGGTGGVLLTSTYDALNRLMTLTQGTAVSSYTYDLNGNTVQKSLPNGDVTSSSYDGLNRTVAMINTSSSGGSLLSSYVYEYDSIGNVMQITEEYGNTTLNRVVANIYDAANRLTQETVTGNGAAITTYTYDAANNRKTLVKGSVASTYTYNTLNQLVEVSSPYGTVVFEYDANGNQTSKMPSSGNLGMNYRYGVKYDFENRVVFMAINNLYSQFTYDYRSRRVERYISGTRVKYIFSGGTSVREYKNSSLSVDYVRGSDWGGGVGGILYSLRNGIASFNHYNRRGDVTGKTDATGILTYQATYEAFGRQTATIGATSDPQRANTKDQDFPGCLNEGHRFRDLDTGTFLTKDPAGFIDGPNLYAYVVQNPWTRFDPEGLAYGLGQSTSGYKHEASPAEQVVMGVYSALIMPPISLGIAVTSPKQTAAAIGAQAKADYNAQGVGGVLNRFNPMAHVMGGALGIDPIQGTPLTLQQSAESVTGGLIGTATAAAGGVSLVNKFTASLGAGAEVASTPGGTTASTVSKITEADVQAAMGKTDLQPTQGAVSLPKVQEFVDKLDAGETAPPIKVDGDAIVEGHHRELAGQIRETPPAREPGRKAPSTEVKEWKDVSVDQESW